MAVTGTERRISLSAAAQEIKLTSQGLLKILLRTNSAIRNDGRWYVDPSIIDQIATARRVLGIARTQKSQPQKKAPLGQKSQFERRRSGGNGKRGVATGRRQTKPKQTDHFEALTSNQPDDSLQQSRAVPSETPV